MGLYMLAVEAFRTILFAPLCWDARHTLTDCSVHVLTFLTPVFFFFFFFEGVLLLLPLAFLRQRLSLCCNEAPHNKKEEHEACEQ